VWDGFCDVGFGGGVLFVVSAFEDWLSDYF
jgi:hypothetical protein